MMEWIEIGQLSDIPRLGARCVLTPAGRIGVFRTADDQVFAIENRCPHRGGPLSEGIVHGHSVTCPLHNWVISLETGAAQGADEGQVPTWPVRNEAGRLFLGWQAAALIQSEVVTQTELAAPCTARPDTALAEETGARAGAGSQAITP